MSHRPNAAWAEVVQLVPYVVLALPFVIDGRVDLSQAGGQFLAAGLVAVPVQALVLARGELLNPILAGGAAWLALGAAAFGLPLEAVAAAYADSQATGLFVAAGVAGLVATARSTSGYVGTRHPDAAWISRASWKLLGITAAAIAWAWVWRYDVRLGGGVPFIFVNVSRRVLIARAPTTG